MKIVSEIPAGQHVFQVMRGKDHEGKPCPIDVCYTGQAKDALVAWMKELRAAGNSYAEEFFSEVPYAETASEIYAKQIIGNKSVKAVWSTTQP